MNSEVEKIKEIAGRLTSEHGLLLIDIVLRGTMNSRVVEIFVDGEKNISAGDCASLSRQILKEIEEEDIYQSGFRLDVSTPGVDRPLRYIQQFPKHINRTFNIIYNENKEKKSIQAKLVSVNEQSLYFSTKEIENLKILFSDIIEAKVLISFS